MMKRATSTVWFTVNLQVQTYPKEQRSIRILAVILKFIKCITVTVERQDSKRFVYIEYGGIEISRP